MTRPAAAAAAGSTRRLWRRYPEAPPYGGRYAEVIPHLTVGDSAPRPVLRAAEAVAGALPIEVAVEAVQIIAGSPERVSWRTVCEFPLGPVGSATP